jgi:hypothetical protein
VAAHIDTQQLAPELVEQARTRGSSAGHHRVLRALGNRLVGILHGCLTHRTPYNETVAWTGRHEAAA